MVSCVVTQRDLKYVYIALYIYDIYITLGACTLDAVLLGRS